MLLRERIQPYNYSRAKSVALAVGAGGGCLDIFFLSSIISLFFLPVFGRRPDID